MDLISYSEKLRQALRQAESMDAYYRYDYLAKAIDWDRPPGGPATLSLLTEYTHALEAVTSGHVPGWGLRTPWKRLVDEKGNEWQWASKHHLPGEEMLAANPDIAAALKRLYLGKQTLPGPYNRKKKTP